MSIKKCVKTEFWTMFYYGSSLTICSKHKNYYSAEKAAIKCEKKGGAKHIIAQVTQYRR